MEDTREDGGEGNGN